VRRSWSICFWISAARISGARAADGCGVPRMSWLGPQYPTLTPRIIASQSRCTNSRSGWSRRYRFHASCRKGPGRCSEGSKGEVKRYGSDSVIQISESGIRGAGSASQLRAGGLGRNGSEFGPDVGDEHVVIECVPAQVLHLCSYGHGNLLQGLFSFHARQMLGDQALKGREVLRILSLEGLVRVTRQVRSICSTLVAQAVGSSCLRRRRIRTNVWWNVRTESQV
jgi:hypothetical protein